MFFKSFVRTNNSLLLSWRPSNLRRWSFFSNAPPSDQIQFTYTMPDPSPETAQKMIRDLESQPLTSNKSGHDAALLVGTPNLDYLLTNPRNLGIFANILAGNNEDHRNKFHILSAIVDEIALPVADYQSSCGLSVLRGHLDHMLPNLKQTKPLNPTNHHDATTSASLSFLFDRQKVTLPLATQFGTPFNSFSALTASSVDLTRMGPFVADNFRSLRSQDVKISDSNLEDQNKQPQLWAPLLPLTQPRIVAASLGNIVKSVDIDGQMMPASTELEKCINVLHEKVNGLLPPNEPVDVWALLAPQSNGSWPQSGLTLEETAEYLQKSHQNGARLAKVLSGGGGWGAKKGMLCLDSQLKHLSSLDDDLEHFKRSCEMKDSGIAPKGSTIQFFTSVNKPVMPKVFPPSIVFGVPSVKFQTVDDRTIFMPKHFSALSHQAIFVSEPFDKDSESGEQDNEGALLNERKISVPNSRLYIQMKVGDESLYKAEKKKSGGGGFGWFILPIPFFD